MSLAPLIFENILYYNTARDHAGDSLIIIFPIYTKLTCLTHLYAMVKRCVQLSLKLEKQKQDRHSNSPLSLCKNLEREGSYHFKLVDKETADPYFHFRKSMLKVRTAPNG